MGRLLTAPGLGLVLLLGCAGASPRPEAAVARAEAGPELGISKPAAGKGRVRFVCEPPDAQVRIDGVTQGLAADFTAPASLELEPGLHQIELFKQGYATYRAEVVVSDEVTETIPVKLRPVQQAAAKEESE